MKWNLSKFDMDFNPVIRDQEGREIATIHSGGENQPTPEEALKHATLIATVNEMRDIIQELADHDGVFHPIELTRKAKQLINQII